MATQAKVRLRWSSGALSLALHAMVVLGLLLFGMASVERVRRAPPLEATLLPLPPPEPLEVRDYRAPDAPRARGAAAQQPAPAPVAEEAAPETIDGTPFMPAPVAGAGGEGTAPAGGEGGAGSGGDGRGAGPAPGATAGEGRTFARPEWIERLTAADMLPFFPRSASQLHVNGTAWLACQVSAGNRARHCRILRETPPDHGFGHAAMRMSRLFRIRPPRRDGLPQYDSWVRIQIDFEVP